MANEKNDRDGKEEMTAEEVAEELANAGRSASSGISVGDTFKKLLTAGVSAAFMTEESIRSFVGEMKLPKETLNLLLQGASKSKEELMSRVSKEVITIVQKIDFVQEATKFMENHKMRVSAEVEFVRKTPSSGEEKGSVDVRFKNEDDV